MDSSPKIQHSPRSPMANENFNVVTSTPFLKSEIGMKLVKKQFIKNFPKDVSISILEAQISKMSISLNTKSTKQDGSNHSQEIRPFIFKKESTDSAEPIYEFRTPTLKSISPETLEKFNKLFDETPKLMRKRIRL
jgi:hypothetical protein